MKSDCCEKWWFHSMMQMLGNIYTSCWSRTSTFAASYWHKLLPWPFQQWATNQPSNQQVVWWLLNITHKLVCLHIITHNTVLYLHRWHSVCFPPLLKSAGCCDEQTWIDKVYKWMLFFCTEIHENQVQCKYKWMNVTAAFLKRWCLTDKGSLHQCDKNYFMWISTASKQCIMDTKKKAPVSCKSKISGEVFTV